MNQLLIGRNHVHVVRTENQNLFEKILVGDEQDAIRRFKNLCLWDSISRHANFKNTPSLVSVNEEKKLLVYECFSGHSPRVQMKDKKRCKQDLEDSMFLLREVHKISLDSPKYVLGSLNPEVGLTQFLFITPSVFSQSSGGELAFYALCHADHKLQEKVISCKNLREKVKNKVISHGDFRVDQVLLQDRRSCIIDFEEICLAWPEYDLGSFFASWLYGALKHNLAQELKEHKDEQADVTLFSSALSTLDFVVPLLSQQIAVYEEELKIKLSHELLSLEVGISMLTRALSVAHTSFQLLSLDKAIMGIAHYLCLNPQIISWR